MSTVNETIKYWLANDCTGSLIADQFEEIVIRECMDEDDSTPQVYVYVSDHKTGFANSFLIAANGDYKDHKGTEGIVCWLKDQYRYVVDYLNPKSEWHQNNALEAAVSHPNHYNQGGLEVIDIIKAFTADLKGEAAFCAGNAIKYILRFHHKNGKEDLEKAKWYINRLEEVLYSDECCNSSDPV